MDQSLPPGESVQRLRWQELQALDWQVAAWQAGICPPASWAQWMGPAPFVEATYAAEGPRGWYVASWGHGGTTPARSPLTSSGQGTITGPYADAATARVRATERLTAILRSLAHEGFAIPDGEC